MTPASLAHVFEILSHGLLWIVACASLIWLHSLQDGGHKRDLSVGAVFFGVNAIARMVSAWNLIQGFHDSNWMLHVASGALAIGTGIYAAMRVGNFALTLIRSEHVERVIKNRIGDGPMEDILLPFASASLRQDLEDVRQNYENRGIRCQRMPGPISSPPLPLSALSSR